MRAAYYEQHGNPEEVIAIGDIDLPEPGEGEVLINVKAAGVNPVDTAVVQGYLKEAIPQEFPTIPGWDFAGVVEECGFSARRFSPGDNVYGYARRPRVQWGTFAEYLVIPESYLARQPGNVTQEEAAAIPLVGLTAYQSLYEAGSLEENQNALILGGSGGVGSFAIQLAKAKSARVVGVASKKNHDYMKVLGADDVIDYKDTDVGAAAEQILPGGVDLLFDCVGGETLQESLPALKSSGKLVSIIERGENIDPGIDFEYVFVEPNARQLEHLRELVEAVIEVPVTRTYSLEETAEALHNIQSLHTRGKTVIQL